MRNAVLCNSLKMEEFLGLDVLNLELDIPAIGLGHLRLIQYHHCLGNLKFLLRYTSCGHQYR